MFDTATASLVGNPTAVGTYDFTLRVDNIGGYAQESFTLTILARPVITTLVLDSGNVSVGYLQALTADGTAPITWSILPPTGDETDLPPGLTLAGHIIQGTPTTQGLYKFTIMAENITGSVYADTRQLTIQINALGAPIITTPSPLYATRGIPYSATFAATSDMPVTWTLDTTPPLPDGLSVTGDTLSGTPNVAGIYTFLMIADNGIDQDTRLFTIIIADPPVINTPTLPDGSTRTAYSATISATGDAPITWQIMPPTGTETGLPPGLQLNENTGDIYGTPTKDEVFTFTIQAKNNAGTYTASYSIIILSVGGTFINGKEIGNLFIAGKEVFEAFVGGVRIY